ncbi:ComF family protein [Patescibacteria group bacterium]|nr:ComF family protein [Patescibacteria group bacterium]
MREILERAKNAVLDMFFPVRCVGCGNEGFYICKRCEGFAGEASLICPACQQSTFTSESHKACQSRYALDGLVNIWEYEGIVKQLLHQIKYESITHAAQELVSRMLVVMIADQQRFGSFLDFLASGSSIITYVPMYKKKERWRGFNQAKLFAQEIAKATNNILEPLLLKTVHTEPQMKLAKKERLYNVKDAFQINPKIQNIEFKTNLQNLNRVILVDDIWTTGATMKECCMILKKAGVKEVWGLTLARTV